MPRAPGPASARSSITFASACLHPPPSLIVPVGDDAAVMTPERGELQVLTTDALVEGVHFDRRFSSLADIGYKAIAVNVSDVAAMGGTPSVVLLSLMLPDAISLDDLDELLDGVLEMAAAGADRRGGRKRHALPRPRSSSTSPRSVTCGRGGS